MPAGDAEGRVTAAFAEQRDFRDAGGQRLDLIDRADAAAMQAGAARIRPQRPLREHHRIGRFQDLGRRDGGGGDRVVRVVQPVAFRIAAEPPAEEGEHHPARAVLALTTQRQRVDRAEGRGRRAVRHHLPQRTEDDADQPQDRLGIARHRPGRPDAEQRGIGDHEFDRAQHAGIGRHIREGVLQRDITGRNRGGVADVDRPEAGRRTAREIQQHPPVADFHVQRDGQAFIGDAVIVQVILEGDAAFRQAADLGLHQRGGAIRKGCEGRVQLRFPMLVQQLPKASLAEVERVELPVQVAPIRLRHARIGREDVEDILLHHARADQLHRRNADAFLVAFRRARIVVARHIAADVEPMPHARQPAEQLALPEHRSDQAEIIEMRAALIGVVEQEGVARLQPRAIRDATDHRLHGEGHGADEDRQALRALHQRGTRFGMIQAVAGVARFRDDGVERAAVERRVHLIRDLLQPPLQDGEGDGVQTSHRASSPVSAAAS